MKQNPRDIKIEIEEYPGYYVDGTGLICYKYNKGFKYCKKADKQSVFIFENGKQITIKESEFADKYVPNWKQHRKKISEDTPTLDSLHNYLQKIIETNADLKQKVKWINEYTNKILNIKTTEVNPQTIDRKEKRNKSNSVVKKDKRRKPNTWKGEFDNNRIELPLLSKSKAEINKASENRILKTKKDLAKKGWSEKEIEEARMNIEKESHFIASANVWQRMVEKYGLEKANELWNK